MNTTTGSFTDAHRTTNARTTEMYGHDLRTNEYLDRMTRDARADARHRAQVADARAAQAGHIGAPMSRGTSLLRRTRTRLGVALVAAGGVIGGRTEDGCPEVAAH